MQFNIDGYKYLLKKAKEKQYIFSAYQEKKEQMIFLRHDVDVSPHLALKMAQIEYELGIKSTYFFMLRSPFYNLFSRANDSIVREIINMGHHIGLHFDEGYYSKNLDLQVLIDEEIDILEKNFNIKIDTVSFHQPSQKIINNEVSIRQINTYDTQFFKEIKYLSDSNMHFKEDPFEIIQNSCYNKLQLLIHPIWWMVDGETTEEKFTNAITLNFELEQRQVLETERAYGLKKTLELKNNYE